MNISRLDYSLFITATLHVHVSSVTTIVYMYMCLSISFIPEVMRGPEDEPPTQFISIVRSAALHYKYTVLYACRVVYCVAAWFSLSLGYEGLWALSISI